MFEISLGSPWYARVDASDVSFDGTKLQAYPQGTGSGNGFVDFGDSGRLFHPQPRRSKAGYSSKRLHFALSYLDSQFDNDDRLLTWTNGYFGNNNPPATATTSASTPATWLPTAR